MLESSRAIKCPSLRYHLAGMKCFQYALLNEQFREKIFPNQKEYREDLKDILEEMFSIDQVEIFNELNDRCPALYRQ